MGNYVPNSVSFAFLMYYISYLLSAPTLTVLVEDN